MKERRLYVNEPVSGHEDDPYLQMLKSFAGTCDYDESMVDRCLEDGFSTDEIEEFLYCGEL